MLRDSQTFLPSHSPGQTNARDSVLARWTRPTMQLDIETSKLRILSQSLTQLHASERQRAIAIHDYVQRMPFGCVPDFLNTKASEVIRLGYGDCHTKGILFVALLRAAGLAARLRFVTLSTRFLSGLIDTGSVTMTHAVGEVYMAGKWQQVDTYVVDTELGNAARTKLCAHGHKLGYGVHMHGDTHWDATRDAHGQYNSSDPKSLPVVDWGVDDDVQSFYADEEHAALRHTFSLRVKWMLGAQMVNRKVAQIRKISP
jgi:Transglutaminase-like superfamily